MRRNIRCFRFNKLSLVGIACLAGFAWMSAQGADENLTLDVDNDAVE